MYIAKEIGKAVGLALLSRHQHASICVLRELKSHDVNHFRIYLDRGDGCLGV